MPNDAEDMAVFDGWMKYYRKSYESKDEMLKKFETFKVYLREAEQKNPLTKLPMWEHLSQFVDLTDEEFSATCLGCESESDDEDARNGIHAWYLDESFATDSGMILKGRDEKEEEGSTVGTLKRKGSLCSCDEKDTKDQVDSTVKRQRPCSCFTPPAAEQRDVAAPV